MIGVLYHPNLSLDSVLHQIEKKLGEIDYQGPAVLFNHSLYYEKEMGKNLKKKFISIQKLWPADQLYATKLLTGEIEQFLSINHQRQVNLDPGGLSLHNLMLLSTKNFSHRIPLQKGIYAELSLLYQENEWKKLPWSYPDFNDITHLTVLSEIRTLYKKQIQTLL